ncbi:hypothetical protein GWK47_013627 [Chionoecetes opilio]|uniref:Uncharacterized protein n=1 Tax=Chionoecetes opilio TaxID=41210 RepID=A0A8J4Y4D5_CHIOP|nr:hypothetical protein GWK47_013627 [Chionoecetes opilio]
MAAPPGGILLPRGQTPPEAKPRRKRSQAPPGPWGKGETGGGAARLGGQGGPHHGPFAVLPEDRVARGCQGGAGGLGGITGTGSKRGGMAKGTSGFLPRGVANLRPCLHLMVGWVNSDRDWGGGLTGGPDIGRQRFTQADATGHRRRRGAGFGSRRGLRQGGSLPGLPQRGPTYSLWRWRKTTYLGGPP